MNATRNRTARAPKTAYEVPRRVMDRVMKKTLKGSEEGCHISLYSVGSHGYAQVGWNDETGRRVTLAHRVAWIAEHGPIPSGMTVDHECKVRRCVNPKHLRLLDNYENGRRTDGRDWPVGQCANGHPNSELMLVGNGSKTPRLRCRPCNSDAQARYRAKRKRLALAA